MIDPTQARHIADLRAGKEVWLNMSGHRLRVTPELNKSSYHLALVPFLTRANLAIINDSFSKSGKIIYTSLIVQCEPTGFNWIRDNAKVKRLGSILEIHPTKK